MKNFLRLAIVAVSALLLNAQIDAKDFKSLLVFGDGFSDTGAGYKLALQNEYALIPSNLYFHHHWSNGPIWSEYLSRKFDLKVQNYAVAGASLGTDNSFEFFWDPLGGVVQQIQRFSNDSPWIGKKTITILAAGQEDLAVALFQNNGLTDPIVASTVQQMLVNLNQDITQLIGLGAKNIIVWNAIDITASPIFNTPLFQNDAAAYSQGIASYNSSLQAIIDSINFSNPASSVYLFDANTAFSQTLSNLQSNGIDIYQHTLTLNFGPPITSTLTGPTTHTLAWYDDKNPTSLFWKAFTPQIADFITRNLDPSSDCKIK
jgi:thermolabile hemolysin